jgi:hypothetical protein
LCLWSIGPWFFRAVTLQWHCSDIAVCMSPRGWAGRSSWSLIGFASAWSGSNWLLD